MTCFDEEPEHQPTKEEWEAAMRFCPVCKIRQTIEEVGQRCGNCGIHPSEEDQVRGYEEMAGACICERAFDTGNFEIPSQGCPLHGPGAFL